MKSNRLITGGIALAGFLFLGQALNLLSPEPCPLRDSEHSKLFPPQSPLANMGQARAIPSLARKYNVTCTTCHTGYAYLNQTGRLVKEGGFRLPDENGNYPEEQQNHQKISDSLVLEKMLPLSMRITSIPAALVSDPTFSKAQLNFAPYNSFGLFAFGNFFQYGSVFVTIEADPETAFNVSGVKFGVHPFPYFNVVAGWAAPLGTDPYVTLASADNPLTITDRALLAQGFDSSVNLVDTVPFITAYGRHCNIYYSASLVGPPSQISTINPTSAQARIAVDATDKLTVGAFGMGGRATKPGDVVSKIQPADYNFGRIGADLNFGTQSYHLSAIGLYAIDQTGSDPSTSYWGASGEFVYFLQSNGFPILAPIGRLEWYQGTGNTNTVTGLLGVAYYWRQNFRLGFDGTLDLVPTIDGQRNWGATFYADLVF